MHDPRRVTPAIILSQSDEIERLQQQLSTARATTERLERERTKLLRMNEPYTLYWTLFHLQAAVKHLFEVHQCDQHGHEVWHHVAYEKTDSLLELLQTPTSEQKEGSSHGA